jgi:hypothetical protein
VAGGAFHICASPQPWPRTGPGSATDGKPRFDLAAFDLTYFDRLRSYVTAAGDEGIYVSVMLFEGFGLHLSVPPNNVEGHPFHAANNVNGISISSIDDYMVLPLDPRVHAVQEAYIRKVVDTVHDLPNMLYEVANESVGGGSLDPKFFGAMGLQDAPSNGDSTEWQYGVIRFVKNYERQQGYDPRPVGMTMQYPVPDQSKVNAPLFDGPADWISPGFDDVDTPGETSRWLVDPPPSDGTKVVLSDTDHYSAMWSDALWAWKTFLRGYYPLLYDLGIVTGVNPSDPSAGSPSFESLEPARLAMGDTRRYAERLRLLAMAPRGDLTSTGYALASPGAEYLVLQPDEAAGAFTVTLEAGAYTVEWHNVATRQTSEEPERTVAGGGAERFKSPSAGGGPVVLYLKRVGG